MGKEGLHLEVAFVVKPASADMVVVGVAPASCSDMLAVLLAPTLRDFLHVLSEELHLV